GHRPRTRRSINIVAKAGGGKLIVPHDRRTGSSKVRPSRRRRGDFLFDGAPAGIRTLLPVISGPRSSRRRRFPAVFAARIATRAIDWGRGGFKRSILFRSLGLFQPAPNLLARFQRKIQEPQA